MHLNLLWLTSSSLFETLQTRFDTQNDVKLVHHHFNHLGSVFEFLFEHSVDLMVLENEYLNHKTQQVLELLPVFNGIKVLIAHEAKNVFFAFKMNIERCFDPDIKEADIEQLIQEGLFQKQYSKNFRKPFTQKIILHHPKKEGLSIIHWRDLISFQKKKEQTLIHQTQSPPILFPTPYEEIKKKNLSRIQFYELTQGSTININHLLSIEFIQSDYYHCLLSDERVMEINGRERARLLKFLEYNL